MQRDAESNVISHWHILFEDFSTYTQDFYYFLQEAIGRRDLPDIELSRVIIKEGGIGSAGREYLRVRHRRVAFDVCSAPYGTGYFFSWWLVKVPARYGLLSVVGLGMLAFAICSLIQMVVLQLVGTSCLGALFSLSPFFVGMPAFFLLLGLGVQLGLIGDEDWVLSLPILGFLYALFFNPTTYYRLDTAYMFRDAIREAVNEVIGNVRQQKGLRMLSEEELRPSDRLAAGSTRR